MAVTYSTPIFSFIQLTETEPECSWLERPCLPVKELSDLQFQVFAEVDGEDMANFLAQQVSASVVTDCDETELLFRNFIGTWELIEAGYYGNPDRYVGYFSFNIADGFNLYPVGTCFNLKLYKEADGTPLYCLATCFKKINDECFTSILAYRNMSNAFGFDYSTNAYNRVRLNFYLHSATDTEESKNYAKSDGSTVQLSYRLWKDYKVKIDYMLENWIERFAVATAHDDLRVTCDYAGVSQEPFVRTEKVDVKWDEEATPQFNMAQSFTVLRLSSPRANVSSNCG